MKIKSTLILFFLFINFSFIYSQSRIKIYNLPQKGFLNITGSGESTFYIKLNKTINSYLNYINIILTSAEDLNPIIIISKSSEKCDINRLFTSIQLRDSVYIFLKKEQLPKNQFYMCIKNRENLTTKNYNIKISNQQFAYIPYTKQGSYYVSDKYTEKMEFILTEENAKYKKDSELNIWVKGNNLQKVDVSPNMKKEPLNLGYVLYSSYNKVINLTISSKIGDLITIGSVIITNKKTQELKENSNEIIISTEKEICFPIKYEPYMMHISGKIYTKKARTYRIKQTSN